MTEEKDGSGENATEAASTQPTDEVGGSADVEMTSVPEQATTDQANPETGETATSSNANQTTDESKKEEKAEDKVKKPRLLETPPEVPEYNLRLVVNIVAARECNAKTFKDTLSLITHLSAIPEAKEIFGEELIRQAQDLGRSILHDLELLVTQISNAETGTDVQAMALARFSPASSDQAKLLRVMTALDWLFDPKPQGLTATKPTDGLETQQKAEILTSLYQNETFVALWKKLSECLTAIRERGNMFNVATILLPLIEVLMVVCKNTTLKEAPLAKTLQAEFTISSPAPEDPGTRMEDLFFNFTEEHRKILNDLVRHNPKLMSGSFSLLVKNSKVLEFDNKRNYFHRKLHSRGTEVRQPHPSLQLAVRRDQVFLDSFKSLYYKKADEFKYGKLNIRFHGEEGVDAGGVTREWFQVLAKQMFNANYALFNPVASDRTTFHPNTLSAVNPEHLTFFKFIGRIIGKALYESRVLDCHFSRAVYKRMLSKPVSIKDMETLDLDYYKSLVWMLENDITDIITETFSVETEEFGETKIVDLIPDGRNVQVTEENKHEYVRLVVEHKMIGSVKEQLEHFLLGMFLFYMQKYRSIH
jgi:E3 ubiquitin-protein ligase HUWE1